jgi:elongator complex protein 3
MQESVYKEACWEIARKLLELPESEIGKGVVEAIKKSVSKKYRLPKLPSNPEISRFIEEFRDFDDLEEKKVERIKKALKLKPVRTVSGVAVVAVMSSPAPCPHGRCVPCPGGVDTPQSYTGKEPAAMRGTQHGYDAFKQVTARLKELKEIGHAVDKVEIIVMGGTFPAREKTYRDEFILGVYNALNLFDRRAKRKAKPSNYLEEAKSKNETAKARCIGMTFETRPDYSKAIHIKEMLEYGGTKVELGVQSIYEDVLKGIRRGHGVEGTIIATELLKDAAFKVGYHVMPGLPGSSFKRDFEMFREIFENAHFKPDYLKIYPTLVVEGTELYEMYKRGEYVPYTTEEVAELIAKAKKHFPKWVRVQRIQRDIPIKYAIGLDKGNLRQIVHEKLKEYGWKCRCIRCREIGHVMPKNTEKVLSNSEIIVERYRASNGFEYFISFENPELDLLAGFIRLRDGKPYFKEIEDHALIRELHVYGTSIPIGASDKEAVQHRGIGEKLLEYAEEIAREKYDRIAVISGVGARDYYRKHGYRKRGNYMAKKI